MSAKDASGGTQLTVCFAQATRNATPDGDAAIETLRPGDLVTVMEAGGPVSRPIRFVGHRLIRLASHPDRRMVAPIRLHAGAIADQVSASDLVVSPDHSILFGDVLIPARLLINHRTVVQELDRASVCYSHVELDRHAILLAEGVACESYLDQDNRGFFDNSGEPLILHPNNASFVLPAGVIDLRLMSRSGVDDVTDGAMPGTGVQVMNRRPGCCGDTAPSPLQRFHDAYALTVEDIILR